MLIGGDFVDRDKHLTPLSVLDGAKMPGVVVQAQILAQLRDGRSIHEVPWKKELVLLTVVALLGFVVSSFISAKRYDWWSTFAACFALLRVCFFHICILFPPPHSSLRGSGCHCRTYAETVAQKLRSRAHRK